MWLFQANALTMHTQREKPTDEWEFLALHRSQHSCEELIIIQIYHVPIWAQHAVRTCVCEQSCSLYRRRTRSTVSHTNALQFAIWKKTKRLLWWTSWILEASSSITDDQPNLKKYDGIHQSVWRSVSDTSFQGRICFPALQTLPLIGVSVLSTKSANTEGAFTLGCWVHSRGSESR